VLTGLVDVAAAVADGVAGAGACVVVGGGAAAIVALVPGDCVGLDCCPAPVGRAAEADGAVATSDEDAAGGGSVETAGWADGSVTTATEEAAGGDGEGSAAMAAEGFGAALGPRASSAPPTRTTRAPPIAANTASLLRGLPACLPIGTPDADDATSGVPRPSAGIVASHCGCTPPEPEPLEPRS
jgi:hypothetical protein